MEQDEASQYRLEAVEAIRTDQDADSRSLKVDRRF